MVASSASDGAEAGSADQDPLAALFRSPGFPSIQPVKSLAFAGEDEGAGEGRAPRAPFVAQPPARAAIAMTEHNAAIRIVPCFFIALSPPRSQARQLV